MFFAKWMFTVVAAVAVICSLAAASDDFVTVLTYTVPGLDSAIADIDLADIDGDGTAEALVTDQHKFLLYSVLNDELQMDADIEALYADAGYDDCAISYTWSPYFTVDISVYALARVLLADVNRDNHLDALLLTHNGCSSSRVRYLTFMADNVATGTSPEIALDLPMTDAHGILSFEALDLDRDGFPNLVMSLDSSYESPLLGVQYLHTLGQTRTYDSFPDSLLTREDYLVTGVSSIPGSDSRLVASGWYDFQWDYTGSGPSEDISGSVLILDEAGAAVGEVEGTMPTPCSSFNTYRRSIREVGCIGDISGDGSDPEILTSCRWQWRCSDEALGISSDSSGASLVLSRLVTPGDVLENIWSVDVTGHNYETFFYYSEYPGCFFAVEADTLFRFNGADGSTVRRYNRLPQGKRFWDYPFGPDRPYLVIVNYDTVTYLSFETATDVDEAPTQNLPASFALGSPYPNPFNPGVTLPVTLREKAHLKVEVYDALGRRVDVVYDRLTSPGDLTVTWDGSAFASGVYLFKATAGEELRTVKAVLVK